VSDERSLPRPVQHNLWAIQKLLAACESIPDEVLAADAKGTYGTVLDTLVHLVAAESRYVMRMTKRGAPENPLREGTFPGFDELKQHAVASGQELLSLAAKTTANETIVVEEDGQMLNIRLSTYFAQAINHGTEHRAHVCTILTQQGIDPPRVDIWGYWETAEPSGRAYRRSPKRSAQ
jgi:uncharacterized damage-inducible protein DinB